MEHETAKEIQHLLQLSWPGVRLNKENDITQIPIKPNLSSCLCCAVLRHSVVSDFL